MERQPDRVKLAQDPWPLIRLLEVFLVFLSGEQGVKWLIFLSRPTAEKAITYHLLPRFDHPCQLLREWLFFTTINYPFSHYCFQLFQRVYLYEGK
jgi:hypothetical protein